MFVLLSARCIILDWMTWCVLIIIPCENVALTGLDEHKHVHPLKCSALKLRVMRQNILVPVSMWPTIPLPPVTLYAILLFWSFVGLSQRFISVLAWSNKQALMPRVNPVVWRNKSHAQVVLYRADSHSAMYPVFDSAHTLLLMLYDRDARRAFTPRDHWLCK